MKYIPESDLWKTEDGKFYVRNEWNPDSPIFIGVSTPIWRVSYQGSLCFLDWDVINLPEGFERPLKELIIDNLKRHSPKYLLSAHYALKGFSYFVRQEWKGFGDISISEWVRIWKGLRPTYRTFIRRVYSDLAEKGVGGARSEIAIELKSWRARKNVRLLRRVLDWDKDAGAFTSDEAELLRRAFKKSIGTIENVKQHAVRLIGWILFETIKRPSQILGMTRSALKEIRNKGVSEWFLTIPKVKRQTSEDADDWRITEELAQEILAFSSRPEVREIQKRCDRLIVWDCNAIREHGELSSAIIKIALKEWVAGQELISPRTNKPLHVTPYRIRHTGATRLAVQGFSSDDIQVILEHDSQESCQAYIDAVGSEVIPAIERADRNLGALFSRLNSIFFKGQVDDEVNDKLIFVPDFTKTPALVGSCGRDSLIEGKCPHHPFHSCYDGCPNFLAWRDGDHDKALQYAESELRRWNAAEGHKERNKNIKDFERLYAAITEVKEQIKQEAKQ